MQRELSAVKAELQKPAGKQAGEEAALEEAPKHQQNSLYNLLHICCTGIPSCLVPQGTVSVLETPGILPVPLSPLPCSPIEGYVW